MLWYRLNWLGCTCHEFCLSASTLYTSSARAAGTAERSLVDPGLEACGLPQPSAPPYSIAEQSRDKKRQSKEMRDGLLHVLFSWVVYSLLDS